MPGFSLGGPIRRNRTFFFVNTQWLKAEQNGGDSRARCTRPPPGRASGVTTRLAAISRPAWRAHRWMPAATRSCLSRPTTSGLTIRRPSGWIPTIRAILATTPLPNNFNTAGMRLNTAGYTFAAPEEEKQMDFVTKIDHNFNNSHGAFVRILEGLSEYAVRRGKRGAAGVPRHLLS